MADYHAVLGLPASATTADVEARYLELMQFLDEQTVPAPLRRWALAQSALIDEAYAALTGADEAEPMAARLASTPARPPARRTSAPVPSVPTHRGRFAEDEHDEEYFEELDEEPEVASRAGGRAPRPALAGRPAGQPRWEQRDRGRGRRGSASAPSIATERGRWRDDRVRKMLFGLGIGLAIVLAGFVMMRAGAWPFSSSQAPAFDQARYNQLTAVVQRDPSNYNALFELGQMTFEADRFKESIGWLEKVLVVQPKDVQSLQDMGTANFNLGNRDLALEFWLKALAVDPNNAQTHWNLSFLYASEQPPNIDAAMGEWRKVIELAPDSQLAQMSKTHADSFKARQGGVTPLPTPRN